MDTVVRRLPARHRAILVATYFRGETTHQAARRLGITPAEARARLYEAMHDLAAVVDAGRPQAGGVAFGRSR